MRKLECEWILIWRLQSHREGDTHTHGVCVDITLVDMCVWILTVKAPKCVCVC